MLDIKCGDYMNCYSVSFLNWLNVMFQNQLAIRVHVHNVMLNVHTQATYTISAKLWVDDTYTHLHAFIHTYTYTKRPFNSKFFVQISLGPTSCAHAFGLKKVDALICDSLYLILKWEFRRRSYPIISQYVASLFGSFCSADGWLM